MSVSAAQIVCIQELYVFFFLFLFFYCVKPPSTNPTVLLLSSGLWKWTGCRTCKVLINQISTGTPLQTLSSYSNSYLCLCSAELSVLLLCVLCVNIKTLEKCLGEGTTGRQIHGEENYFKKGKLLKKNTMKRRMLVQIK